jgi:hypothetical protein
MLPLKSSLGHSHVFITSIRRKIFLFPPSHTYPSNGVRSAQKCTLILEVLPSENAIGLNTQAS